MAGPELGVLHDKRRNMLVGYRRGVTLVQFCALGLMGWDGNLALWAAEEGV